MIGSEADRDLEHRFPFLRYVTTNWVPHAQVVEEEQIPQADLLELFQWPSVQILQHWAHLYQVVEKYSIKGPTANTSLLHIASRYGLLSVLTAVLNSENNANVDMVSKDTDGQTPLSLAARYGHLEI